jgi:predicted nucleic acid-binding protein
VKVIVDTGIWSLALRRRSKNLSPTQKSSAMLLRDLIAADLVILLGIVRQELLSGVRPEQAFARMAAYLREFEDPPPVVEDYEQAARFRGRCDAAGVASSAPDMLICAMSVRFGAPILTADADFDRYASALGVRVAGIDELRSLLQ